MGSSSHHSLVLLTRLAGFGLDRSRREDSMQDPNKKKESFVLSAPGIRNAHRLMLMV